MEFKYYSVKEILNFLEVNGLSVNKRFGQNFLINSGVCDSIVKSLDITGDDIVFEVGCGLGSLTNRIVSSPCKQVIGFEIDNAYIKHIKDLFKDEEKFSLVPGDFLKNFETVTGQFKGKKQNLIITGNLPYYITTPIIEKIFTSGVKFTKAAFMMQKEVAERIVSPPGSKKYGSISVFCNYYSEPKIVAKITAGSFYPQPNVDSAVVRFTMKNDKVPVVDEKTFFKVTRSLFINRRKQLKNNLMSSPLFENLTQDDVAQVLEESGIKPTDRGETLSIERIALLSDNIYRKISVK